MESSFFVPLGDINLLRLSASLGCDVSVEPRLSFCLFAWPPTTNLYNMRNSSRRDIASSRTLKLSSQCGNHSTTE